MCTDKRILVLNIRSKEIRFTDQYADLMGITKSLRIGSNNLIFHFGTRADEEWFCDKREELIDTVVAMYKHNEGRDLPAFGVASQSLEDYLTTEKDLVRKVSRMPAEDYLIQGNKKYLGLSQSQVVGTDGDMAFESEW